MHVVVGLGNPGARYERTRHNLGFRTVEHLAAKWNIPLREEAGTLRTGRGKVAGTAAVLVEPLLYMNRSGLALTKAGRDWKAEDLVVAYGDLDLPAGWLRIRHGGGTGGHRGVESIAAAFGPDFVRVRLGIGRPPEGMAAADYVLTPILPEETPLFEAVTKRAAEAIEVLLSAGLQKAMNDFNGPMNG